MAYSLGNCQKMLRKRAETRFFCIVVLQCIVQEQELEEWDHVMNYTENTLYRENMCPHTLFYHVKEKEIYRGKLCHTLTTHVCTDASTIHQELDRENYVSVRCSTVYMN